MSGKKLIGMSGIALSFSVILLFIWYLLMGLLLPFQEMGNSFLTMVRDKDWMWINISGMLACLIMPLGLVGMYCVQIKESGKSGLTGFLLTFIGVVLYGCVQYIETFVWPLIAVHAPNLLNMDGEMFTNKAFGFTYMLMGLMWITGFIVFGIASLRAKVLPKWGVWLFMTGAVVFGTVLSLVYVRILGCAMFTAGGIWIGIEIAKKNNN